VNKDYQSRTNIGLNQFINSIILIASQSRPKWSFTGRQYFFYETQTWFVNKHAAIHVESNASVFENNDFIIRAGGLLYLCVHVQ